MLLSRRSVPSALKVLLPLVLLASAGEAHAVGTRQFVLDSLERLSGGDVKGVAIGSDGVVRAGMTLGSAPLGSEAQSTFAAITLKDGSVLVGTSPNGKVIRVVGDAAQPYADTGSLAVTALAELKDGTVIAATIPDGKLVKVAQGKVTPFATLPDTSYVWALAVDKTGTGVYAAAGGPEGKLFHVRAGGQPEVLFKSDEPHLVSLALGKNDDIFVGSSGKGILYKVKGPGRAEVLYDFPGEEVKAIAVGADGSVFACANEYGEPPEPPRRNPVAVGRSAPGPSVGARPKPGKGVLYKFDPQGRPEKLMAHTDLHYTALTLDERGAPHVGTGAEGRVYTVDESHAVTLEADTDERQVNAIVMVGGKGFVATSDPPVLHRIVGQGGGEAVWTSKVLDTGLRARFGKLSWQGQGRLEVSTRAGNTAAPDGTWSPWSAAQTQTFAVVSPQSRYVQVRARFVDPRATLAEVTLPFVTENLRPVVLEVNAAPKTAPSKEPKDGIPASGGELPKHDTTVKISWKIDNLDSDVLRYRVTFRRDGQSIFHDVTRPDDVLSKTELDWDTQTVPEGKYRVRVEASDEISNAPREAQRHAKESATFVIDNTPPTIADLTLAGRRLRLRVTDGFSNVARVEIAVDGKTEFRPVAAQDGIFDSLQEGIDDDLTTLVPAGSHVVTVRAYDAAGNATSRDIDAK